jgi:hypothetical protein
MGYVHTSKKNLIDAKRKRFETTQPIAPLPGED